MKKPPFRLWIGLMVFWTTFTCYLLRVNMSISIIKMVDKARNHTPPCKVGNWNPEIKNNSATVSETFDWNDAEIGWVLSGYFYGYVSSLVPGGLLAEWVGPFHVIFWSSIGGAILTGLSPICAQSGGWVGIMVNRIIIGIFGGLYYPAIFCLVSKWSPPKEKGKFSAAMMGNTVGMIVSFYAVGLVTQTYGWEMGFYVLVGLVGVFCVGFFFVVTDDPWKSRWTSEEEKQFIFESQEGHLAKKKAFPPYVKLLTSVPFWALAWAQFGNKWGLNLTVTHSPKFLAETIGRDLTDSAGLASIPYLARLVFSVGFGFAGDWMRKKEIMSVTNIRKFFIVFSHVLPGICFLLIIACGCNDVAVVSLLVLHQAFNGALVVSQLINSQDLCPNFAGTCFGIANCFGMMSGLAVPPISGVLNEKYEMSAYGGGLSYVISGVIYLVTAGIFLIFASGEVQPWNAIPE